MDSTTVYSSKPAPISNLTRRSSVPTSSSATSTGMSSGIPSSNINYSGNVNYGTGSNKLMDESIKSRPLSSLSATEWKQIIMGKLDEYERRLRENKRILAFESKYIGRRLPLSSIIASILIFSLISIIYIFSGMKSLATIVGVVYPFYMSLKVLNVSNVNEMNSQDNMLWLSYWIWYGIFTTFENIGHILFCWMGNMYEIMKMALYVYLYHPQTKGALFLYRRVLQPLVNTLIHYEHVMILNVNTLRKNITISDQDQNGNINFNNPSMTNISANTSKNFGMNSSNIGNLPSSNFTNKSNISMPSSNTSSMTSNAPLNMPNNLITNTSNNAPINPNIIPTNPLPNTFVPFQPMAFAATTPLNANLNTIPNPVVTAAPLNSSNVNPNSNINNMNNLPPQQNNANSNLVQ